MGRASSSQREKGSGRIWNCQSRVLLSPPKKMWNGDCQRNDFPGSPSLHFQRSDRHRKRKQRGGLDCDHREGYCKIRTDEDCPYTPPCPTHRNENLGGRGIL